MKMKDFVILDTETTGIQSTDEVIELGIVASDGTVLFDELFRPTVRMSDEAAKVTGISQEMLDAKLPMSAYMDQIKSLLKGKTIFAYNTAFDREKMIHTAGLYGEGEWMRNAFDGSRDVMKDFMEWSDLTAEDHRWTDDDKWMAPKLEDSLYMLGIEVVQSHRAADDCIQTLKVMERMKSDPPEKVSLIMKLKEKRDLKRDDDKQYGRLDRKYRKMAKTVPYSYLYRTLHMSIAEASGFRNERQETGAIEFFRTAAEDGRDISRFLPDSGRQEDIMKNLNGRYGRNTPSYIAKVTGISPTQVIATLSANNELPPERKERREEKWR